MSSTATGILIVCLLVGTSACDGHKATAKTEKLIPARNAALSAAVRNYEGGPASIRLELISSSNRSWVRVQTVRTRDDILLHLRSRTWVVANVVTIGQHTDGGCAFAPANVMRELYGVDCPPERVLQARRATASEKAALRAVFLGAIEPLPLGNTPADVHLVNPCVSRLYEKWASAGSVYGNAAEGERGSSAGSIVWFHRTGTRWKTFWPSEPPPPVIVRSLASCVGYGAAEYER